MSNTISNFQRGATAIYTHLGAAVWIIQHLEDALNKSIALKDPEATTKIKADEILNSNRELTLGKAVKLASRRNIYSKALQKGLDAFLVERNWLIHRCMHESVDEQGFPVDTNNLLRRLRSIELSAHSLIDAITIDMLEFVKSKGRHDIVESVKRLYLDWQKNSTKT